MSTYASVGFSSFVDLDGTPAVALGRARSQFSGPRTVRGNNSKLATVIFKVIRTDTMRCRSGAAPHTDPCLLCRWGSFPVADATQLVGVCAGKVEKKQVRERK